MSKIYFLTRHGQNDWAVDADQEYIWFIGSETTPSLRFKLLTEMRIPVLGIKNKWEQSFRSPNINTLVSIRNVLSFPYVC